MENIEISLLVENGVCDTDLLGEWGVSMYIKYKEKAFLFDTWATWVFIENAKQMWINLDTIKLVVLSHHHDDHVGWLFSTQFAENKSILAHSELFKKVWEKINWNYKKIESDSVYEISKGMYFLWEIPRKNDFERWNYWEDKMRDDTALAFKTDSWVLVVSWCSHAWIVNICEYAKKVTWEERLYWVLWGFHLLDTFGWIDDYKEWQVEKTLEYFKKEKPKYLYPFHCVDFNILTEFKKEFDIEKLSTGSKIIISG